MTLKARLLFTIISLVVGSILLMGVISVNIAVNESTKALTNSVKARLVSQNVQTKEALVEYFDFIESQIRAKSYSLDVVEATKEFLPAYNNYTSQRGAASNAELGSLESYYNVDFTSQYNISHPKPLSSAADALNGLSDNALTLQYDFIAGSSYALGEKDGLSNLANGTSYARVHNKYHPTLRKFQQEFHYYDVFIVDSDTGNIIYSVFKELDYATSISTGPYADSGIGKAFKAAANASGPDEVYFSQFEQYRPSYDALAGFASTPIYADGRQVAVLIFQMPMDIINNILTHHGDWKKKGFGESGETYLVNDKGLLMNESRFFVDDKKGYLGAIRGKYSKEAKVIELSDTSVGIQPVDSSSVTRALRGESGFHTIDDYRDVEVFSEFYPMKIGEYSYALMAEVDVEEALRPAGALRNSLVASAIIEMLVLVAIAVAITLWFASKLIRPLTRLGDTCEELSHGEADLTVVLKSSGIPEVDRISTGFNLFIGQIREIVSQMKTDADSLASASQQLSVITDQSSQRTAQQKQQTELVASAIEELSASISEVTQSTVETRAKSDEAQRGLKENVQRTDLAAENIKLLVHLIKDSSEVIGSLKNEVNQITNVLGVITSIADQTNLLALNAAIEAARAGEAGRGFSVVADEVRALATRSQESTVEIAKMVEVMNQSSIKSVDAMEKASEAASGGIHLVDLLGTAMNELSISLEQMSTLTHTVATASEEQNVTSDSVAKNIVEINEVAVDVEEGGRQTSESAHELARIAAHTHQLVSRFIV